MDTSQLVWSVHLINSLKLGPWALFFNFKLKQMPLSRTRQAEGLVEGGIRKMPWSLYPLASGLKKLPVTEEENNKTKVFFTIELRSFPAFKESLSHFPSIHLLKCITERHWRLLRYWGFKFFLRCYCWKELKMAWVISFCRRTLPLCGLLRAHYGIYLRLVS